MHFSCCFYVVVPRFYFADCSGMQPFGGICAADNTCQCDASKCQVQNNINGELMCELSCDCPEDCSSGTCLGTPLVTCVTCDQSALDAGGSTGCPSGSTCDGLFCIPASMCTARKNQMCGTSGKSPCFPRNTSDFLTKISNLPHVADNAYFHITGGKDKRSKCCPPTSSCLSNEINLSGMHAKSYCLPTNAALVFYHKCLYLSGSPR